MGLPVVGLVLLLVGCSPSKKDQYVDSLSQVKSYDNQKTVMTMTGAGTASAKKVRNDKTTTYLNRNTQVLRMDYKYKNTATGKSTNLAYYMDLKNHDMYMAITPIMSISSSSLYKKSDLAVFDGKYLKTHAEGSNSANASTSFSSLLTDTKFQSGSKKDLEKVLKDADEKKFKQKDDKISYTFNGKQLAKLYKLTNARLKEKKATKDLALTDSQLKNMTEAMKKMKLTETVNVKTNEITSYKLKQGGATYNIKSKISKSNVKITVPDEQDVMSQAEMQKEMSKIIEKSLKN